MRYIILAGGLGTRLQSVIRDVPKPMAPINGRPFLQHLLNLLLRYEAEEFILCVSHKREIIMDSFGGKYRDVPLEYSIEESPLGTGGAIAHAFRQHHLECAIAVNGDTIINADFTAFARASASSSLGLMLVEAADTSRYGRVETRGGQIVGFLEKGAATGPGLINAGSYWLTKAVVDLMPKGAFSLEKDFLEPRVNELKPSFFVVQSYFMDIGTPESYIQACNELGQTF